VVTQKRTLLAMSGTMGALAAALMLASGCAPVSYDTAGDSNPVPAAAEVSESAGPEASADPDASAAPAGEDEVELAPEQLTEKLIAKSLDQMGNVVADEEGFLLYRFDKDSNKPAISNCNGDCAIIWPPALTDGEPTLEGVDEELVGTVLRSDGTRQITLDGWPLYRYLGDEKAGQWKGQKVGGTWFIAAPDGKKNLECLPEGTPKAVPLPKKEESGKESAPEASSSAKSSDFDY
jgi:predicted lipoprotein with Yx(FWY)xxD motif